MNIQETLALIEALKGAGATHFKSQDLEVTLDPKSQTVAEKPQPIPASTPVEENIAATQKLKDLIGTLNLSNEELIDKIFPAGSGG